MARDVPAVSAAGVVVAGGSGNRFGGERNKAYLPLDGRPLASWGLRALAGVPGIATLVLVIRPGDRAEAERMCAEQVSDLDIEVVEGGATRHESERNALRHLAGRVSADRIDAVLIHDAARPLAGSALAENVLRTARDHGGAVPALPADDIVTVDDAGVSHLASRGEPVYVRAQTPQGFRARPLLHAFESAAADEFDGTDTTSCVIGYTDVEPRWIPGDVHNIKVTHPHDLQLAEHLLHTSRFS